MSRLLGGPVNWRIWSHVVSAPSPGCLLKAAARINESKLPQCRTVVCRTQYTVYYTGYIIFAPVVSMTILRLYNRFTKLQGSSSLSNGAALAVTALRGFSSRTIDEQFIVKSPHGDVDVPDKKLVTAILEKCTEHGDATAVKDAWHNTSLTFNELSKKVREIAAGLYSKGVRKGDVLALHSPNRVGYASMFHAAGLLGATVTTMSPVMSPDELSYQLSDSGASYIVTGEPVAPIAVPVAERLSGVKDVFAFEEGDAVKGCTLVNDIEALGSRIAQEGGIDVDFFNNNVGVPVDNLNDVAVIPYSSGTSGLPKGVCLSNRNLLANVLQILQVEHLTKQDSLIGVLPLFHIYGMLLIMNVSLYAGSHVTLMPKFDLEGFLSILQNEKVTRAHVAPPILVAIAKHPLVDKYDLSSVKVWFSGAAPLGKEVEAAVEKRIPTSMVKQAYGMTEMSPASNISGDHNAKSGSVGPLIAGMEAYVRCLETGKPKKPSEEGEICMKGPNVMLGYHNKPDADGDVFTEEGFFRTGDVGYFDDDGFLFITDRVKELIKVKGYQVAPAELESLLLSHDAIADAAVVPVADEAAGEKPKAFVVIKPDHSVTEEEVKSFVKDKVSYYKQIAEVEFIDAIPKSAAGKILRRLLRN